jgi:hypothetical protein
MKFVCAVESHHPEIPKRIKTFRFQSKGDPSLIHFPVNPLDSRSVAPLDSDDARHNSAQWIPPVIALLHGFLSPWISHDHESIVANWNPKSSPVIDFWGELDGIPFAWDNFWWPSLQVSGEPNMENAGRRNITEQRIQECQIKVADALRAASNSPAVQQMTTAPQQAGQPQQMAMSAADLWPIFERVAPYATHAAFAWLAQQYGTVARDVLTRYGPQIQAMLSAEDWRQLHELLHIIMPDSVAPHVAPDIRPVFGL